MHQESATHASHTPTLRDLLEAKMQLEAQIDQARRESVAQAIATIKDIMADNGLTLADLGATEGKRSSKTAPRKSVGPAKYRDPTTGATWTGRGRKPAWFDAGNAAAYAVS